MTARFLARWELDGVGGTVVAIDVIRAFTTAAYAFGAGAREIWLVAGVEEALALGDSIPGALVMGEDRGRRPEGFTYPNSPVVLAGADLEGRTLVQRTSAGTQGVVMASDAERLFAASLVCASATAAAVDACGLGAPTYVITGRHPDRPDSGADDLLTATFIEALRRGEAPPAAEVAVQVANSDEALRTLAIGGEHVHHDDVAFATDVDRFAFAMEVRREVTGLRLTARHP
ncbi:MAG: 2-phosphosulfolactate phosphatase [Ilumatobacteraceae bacterium]